jgi:protein-S-isoprenylcysteine O-methyltransferase Ste14
MIYRRGQTLDREPTVVEVFSTMRFKELWGNLVVHVFILIPASFGMAYLARMLDRDWGWPETVGMPWNVAGCAVLWIVGAYIIWYSYGYLFIKGKGSPGGHMGYTTELVDTGIYSWIRHPSVIGKLIGVIGLGVLMRSPAFLVVFIPVLLLYSYITNKVIQERVCLDNLGDRYERYRQEVPMFIPRWSRFMRFLRERGKS